MTNCRRSEDDPQSPRERITAETAGVDWVEEALRGARLQLEKDVRGWVAELTAANTALGREFGSQKRFWGITADPIFFAEPQTNGVGERLNLTHKEQAIHGRLIRNLEEVRTAAREFLERYNAHWRLEELSFLSPREARQADAIRKDARCANLRPINRAGLQFEECGYRTRWEEGISW